MPNLKSKREIAVLLNLCMPGLGQFYIKRPLRGLLLLAGALMSGIGILWDAFLFFRSYIAGFINTGSPPQFAEWPVKELVMLFIWILVFTVIVIYSIADVFFRTKNNSTEADCGDKYK